MVRSGTKAILFSVALSNFFGMLSVAAGTAEPTATGCLACRFNTL